MNAARGLSLWRRSHPYAAVRASSNVCILYLIFSTQGGIREIMEKGAADKAAVVFLAGLWNYSHPARTAGLSRLVSFLAFFLHNYMPSRLDLQSLRSQIACNNIDVNSRRHGTATIFRELVWRPSKLHLLEFSVVGEGA